MALGALITVPIGTYALTQLDPVTTRWIIVGFVTALLTLLISGWRYHGKGHPALSVGVGGLAGFCSGLAQTGGPPIVAYWLSRPAPRGTTYHRLEDVTERGHGMRARRTSGMMLG